MKRDLRWYDYITINGYWFALTTRSQVLTPLVVPLLVQQFVGEAQKGAYVGRIRLWALMAAVLVQALMGMLSDRSTSRWGRRRPFIVAGTLGELVVFTLIGLTTNMSGMAGYWALFALYILSMLSSNTAHAATQGLIPDLVPEEKRGAFSGVKALMELPVPLIFVSFVVGGMVSGGNLWGALITLMVIQVVFMLLTLPAPEVRIEKPPFPLDWKPFLRLLLMTAAFTIIILGTGALAKTVLNMNIAAAPAARNLITGAAGLLAMAVAVILGVWVSIRISIGEEARENPSFTWWVITRLAFLVGSTNLAGFMVYFLQEQFPELQGEAAAGPAAQLTMFVGIFILLTALPSGWLSDRFGKKLMVALSGILATLGTLVFILVPNMTVMYIGACLVGAGVGLFYSANWALGTEIVPQDQAGRYLGLSNLAGAGAGAIGAYIGGPIADTCGYTVLFVIYGALFLLSVFTLTQIKEPQVAVATA
ncbi:MAG: MFS transporter [Anaerolineae bacterium]|nr:MFS transporter [Anaerolineae bacterium]